MQKYNGQLIRQFASSVTGNAASGVTVTVRRQSDAGFATLYVENDIAGAALSNPLTTSSTGHFAFYAADGVYTLTFSDNTPQQVIQLQDTVALQEQFDSAVMNAGYIPSGTFAAGATLTQANQVLSDGSSYWRWDGSFPKTVTAGSSPTPTGAGQWILVSDQALRADLAASGSNVLIGGVEASDIADNVVYPVTLGKSLETSQFSGLTPSKPSSLLKISNERFRYFLHLGGRTWQVGDLVNSGLDSQGNVTPFGWSQTDIIDFTESYVWGDAGVTSSGSSFALTSTDPSPYIGHQAIQMEAVAAYVEVSVQVNQAGANVYLNFSGRTTGNIVNVTIDGSTALVNEATTVDTYTPVDLTHRQSALVASNLPAKSTPYLIRFTVSASKNPSSGAGDRFIFNAITLDGGEFGNPWSARVRPKPWTASTAVSLWEERIGQFGRVYVATVAGTTGATAPSHTTGNATDGTVTWAYIASSSFTSRTQTARLQAEGSQLEYAYEFRKTGDSNYQDVGGNLHGNEYLTGLRIYSDGALRNVGIGQYLVGNNIQVVQDIYAYYGALPTVEHLANTTLTHSIGGGRVVVSHQSEFKLNGNFGYHYPAMWPIVYYSATDARTTFDEMELKQAGKIDPDSYSGQVNPFVGGTTDLQMRAYGSIYKAIGTQVSPTITGGDYYAISTLTVTDYGMGDYTYGSRLASMAPNLSGATTASGGASWVMKMYFARSNTDKTEPVTVGKVVRSDAEYKVSLF